MNDASNRTGERRAALIAQGEAYYGVNVQMLEGDDYIAHIEEEMRKRGATVVDGVFGEDLILVVPDPDTDMLLILVEVPWDGSPFGFDSGRWEDGNREIEAVLEGARRRVDMAEDD